MGFRVSGFLESRRDGWMHGWMDGGREREGEGGRGREREGEGGREGWRRSLEGSGFSGLGCLTYSTTITTELLNSLDAACVYLVSSGSASKVSSRWRFTW